MRVLIGVIVALIGAVTAFAVTIVLIYALFSSGDALIWVPMMLVFGFLSLPTGAVLAVALWSRRWPKASP